MHVHDVLLNHWDIDSVNQEQRQCLIKCESLHTSSSLLSADIVFDLFFDQLSQQIKECHICWVGSLWSCACQSTYKDFSASYSYSESDSDVESVSCSCVWLKCQEFSASSPSPWL